MNSSKTVVRLGIDIDKNSFHVWGVNEEDERVLKKKGWSERLVAGAGESTGVLDRDGGVWRCLPLGARAESTRTRGAAYGAAVGQGRRQEQ